MERTQRCRQHHYTDHVSRSNTRYDESHSCLLRLQAAFPRLDIPDGSVTEEVCEIDASRVTRDLGLKYTPFDETLVDMAKSLIDLGISVPRFTAAI